MSGTVDQDRLWVESLASCREQQARELLAVAERLLGEGALMDGLRAAVVRWRSDMLQIAAGASGACLVAVIGTKNSGKSTLIRSLVKDPGVRGQIPCGIAPADGTRQLIWVGPAGPERPNREHEMVLLTGSDGLANLGREYTLLDVPGVDDDGSGLFDLARDAVLTAPVKLLLVRQKELEAGSVRGWSRLIREGSRVVPVVVGESDSALKDECLAQWRKRNAPDLGQAAVVDPVWVPFVRGADEADRLAQIRAAVVPALRQAVQSADPAVLAKERAGARWHRFRREVEAILQPFRANIGDVFDEWEDRKNEILREAITKLMGDSETAESTLRMDWRMRMIGRMPSFYFPQKAALSLLAIMAGKWDRLTMGAMGSVPSFLMAVAGGVGNLRRHRQLKGGRGWGLSRRLELQSGDLLKNSAYKLDARLDQVLPNRRGETNDKQTQKLSFRWQGVEALEDWFHSLLAQEIKTSVSSASRAVLHAFGLLGTGLFWAFLSGPLFALYSSFLGAWGSTDLTQFPNHGWGTLGMGILLAILPIMLLAMAQLLINPGKRQLKEIHAELRREFELEVRNRAEDGRLQLKSNHARFDELGRLIAWLNQNDPNSSNSKYP